MARLLITGASGFLGWNLARSLRAEHEIRGTFCRNPVPVEGCAMDRADLSSGEGIAEVVEAFAPDAIIQPGRAARVRDRLARRGAGAL